MAQRGDIKSIEWTPSQWWVVQVTGADGSLTPLAGPFKSRRQAENTIADDTRFQPERAPTHA